MLKYVFVGLFLVSPSVVAEQQDSFRIKCDMVTKDTDLKTQMNLEYDATDPDNLYFYYDAKDDMSLFTVQKIDHLGDLAVIRFMKDIGLYEGWFVATYSSQDKMTFSRALFTRENEILLMDSAQNWNDRMTFENCLSVGLF